MKVKVPWTVGEGKKISKKLRGHTEVDIHEKISSNISISLVSSIFFSLKFFLLFVPTRGQGAKDHRGGCLHFHQVMLVRRCVDRNTCDWNTGFRNDEMICGPTP